MKSYRMYSLLIALIFMFLGGCEAPIKKSKVELMTYLQNELGNSNFSFDSTRKEITFPNKKIKFVTPEGATLSELGKFAYKDVHKFQKKSLGGVKLCSELSAGKSGIINSNQIQEGKVITFYSIGELKLELIDVENMQDNIITRILKDDIEYIGGTTF